MQNNSHTIERHDFSHQVYEKPKCSICDTHNPPYPSFDDPRDYIEHFSSPAHLLKAGSDGTYGPRLITEPEDYSDRFVMENLPEEESWLIKKCRSSTCNTCRFVNDKVRSIRIYGFSHEIREMAGTITIKDENGQDKEKVVKYYHELRNATYLWKVRDPDANHEYESRERYLGITEVVQHRMDSYGSEAHRKKLNPQSKCNKYPLLLMIIIKNFKFISPFFRDSFINIQP